MKYKIILIAFLIFSCIGNIFATSYVWNGSVSSSWTNSSNWTPNGVPGLLDNVTVVNAGTSPVFNGSSGITNFTINASATLDLGGFNLLTSGTNTFTGGVIKNGTISSTIATATTFNGTTFNANCTLNIISGAITINGGVFNGTTTLTQNGAASSTGTGNAIFSGNTILECAGTGSFRTDGNMTFNGTTELRVSNSGYLLLELTSGNTYNGLLTLTVTPTGTANLRMAYLGNSFFNNNILLQNTGSGNIYFCEQSTATATLASSYTISVGGAGFLGGNLYLYRFTQNGTAAQNLILTGTSTLTLGPSSTFNGNFTSSSSGLLLSGCIFNQTSSFTKNGASNDNGTGLNVFEGICSITNSGSGNLILGNVNPDVFESSLTVTNNGTANIQLANNSQDNEFHSDVTFNNNGATASSTNNIIYVAESSNASAIFKGTVNITNTSVANTNTGGVYFANGNTSNVTFLSTVNATNNGSGSSTNNIAFGDGANSSVNFSGNVIANNTGSSNSCNFYFAIGNPSLVTFANPVNFTNNSTGNTAQFLISGKSVFSGLATFSNSGSGSSASQFQVAYGTSDTAIFSGGLTTINSGSSPSTRFYFASGNTSYVSISSLNLNNTGTGTNVDYNIATGASSNVVITSGSTITNAATGTNDVLTFAGGTGSTVSFPTGMTFNNSSSGSSSTINIGSGSNSILNLSGTTALNNNASSTNGYINIANGNTAVVNFSGAVTATNNGVGVGGTDYITFSNGTNAITTFLSTLNAINSGSNTNNDFYFSNATSSQTQFSSPVTINNIASGSGSNYIYISTGNNALSTFANSVNFTNNSPGYNAQFLISGSSNGSKSVFSGPALFTNSGSSTNASYFQVAYGTSDTAIFSGGLTTVNSGSAPNTNFYIASGNSSYVSISSLNLNNTGNGTNVDQYFATGNPSNVVIASGSTITNLGAGSSNNILTFAGGTGSTINFPTGMTFNNSATGTNGTINIGSGSSSIVNLNGTTTLNNNGLGTNEYMYVANGNNSTVTFSSILKINNNSTGIGTDDVFLGSGTSSLLTFNGDVTLNNAASGSQSFIGVAEGNPSTAIFNGLLTLNNSGSATNSYLRIGLKGNVTCNGNIIVTNTSVASGYNGIYFGWGLGYSGTTTLGGGNTISNGTFSLGNLLMENFTQLGSTAQTMTLTGTADMTIGPSSAFNGNVNFISPQMYLNGCNYNGSTSFLEKDGVTTNNSIGGNIFNSITTIKNVSSGLYRLAVNNPDDFQKSATFIQTGSAALEPTYGTVSTFEGDISTVGTTTAITFGVSASSASEIDGSVTQNINGASALSPVFTTLDMNQAVGDSVILNVPVSVSTALNLTSGTIKSTSSNLLTLLNNTSTSVGNSASYVNGQMAYNMALNGSRTLNFPIGKFADWRPATFALTHNAGTSFTYTAEVFDASASALAWTLPATVNLVSKAHYWVINRTITGGASAPSTSLSGNQTATLYYGANDGVTDPSNVTVCKNTTGAPTTWIDIGGTGATVTSGSVTSTSSPSAFNSFSTFTLGNKIAGTNPLPIQLLSFDAQLNNNEKVNVTWTVSSQVNNNFFTIQRTTDGINFETVAVVAGAGTTTEKISYSALDENPLVGTSYYRLQQTDYDGNYTFSDLVAVNVDSKAGISLFPNPTNQNLTLRYNAPNTKTIFVKIKNVIGQTLATYNENLQIGENSFPFDVTQLSAGIYFLQIGDNYQTTNLKFVKQ